MLTTASQFTPRARSLQTQHAVAARIIRVSAVAGIQQPQQARGFRLGMWFSHLDPELRHEIRRRHRVLKHKDAEQVNRRLSWDKQPFAEDARHSLRRMMMSCWISHDARSDGRSAAAIDAEKQRTPANEDGARPGQNIEDVERGAIDHLLFGKDEEQKIHNPRSGNKQNTRDSRSSSVHHSSYGSIERNDFVIDPITNRRVAKHPAPSTPKDDVNIPVKTFKDHRLQASEPIKLYPDLDKYKPVMDKEPLQFEDLKPPPEDLDNYRSVVVDEITARLREEEKEPYSDLDKYRSAVVDETTARFREEEEEPYSDLDRYRSAVVDETTARFHEEGKETYRDLDKYKSVTDEIASPKDNDPPRYDDVGKYKSFRHNEPDGKPPGYQVDSVTPAAHQKYESFIERVQPGDFPQSTVEDLQKKYDSAELKKYTAVRHLEPDGSPGPTAEELSKSYSPEELDTYRSVKWNESDGNPMPSTDPRIAEGLSKDYDPDELARYGPVRWNEPDGKPTPSADARVAEGLTKDYGPEELAQYSKPVYWNEPNGQPLPSQDERSAEGLTKDYADLEEYSRAYRWNEPDGKPMPSADPRVEEEITKNYKDLDGYGRAYRWNEPDGRPTPSADPRTAEDLTKDYADLGDYNRAYTWNEPDGKPANTAEELSKDYTDLDKYGTVKYQGADDHSATQADPVQQGQDTDSVEKSNYRKMLNSLMKRHQTASDAIDREASLAVKSAKAKAQQSDAESPSGTTLTGNYVRDFPEEFEESWTGRLYKGYVQPEAANMDGGLEGAFGQPSPSKVQPALDRQPSGKAPVSTETRERASADLYSKKPEGQERPESTGEPTLYKILAYDSTMQEIKVAETSSFVPDTASALTPAEALARLSNPARFFPHFAPLEAEGYEIVSGTGDVLVFRKVRSAPTKQAEEAPVDHQPASSATETEAAEPPVNPIDMTGRAKISPASANFASPTGYVNYENLPEAEASNLPPPPPRIKYNIDVQREEPVFSGPKTRGYNGQAKKKSLGKRLVVGGVWVASISYALGVVSEYFTTGGTDGLGPKGL